jgi:hypothetical protein
MKRVDRGLNPKQSSHVRDIKHAEALGDRPTLSMFCIWASAPIWVSKISETFIMGRAKQLKFDRNWDAQNEFNHHARTEDVDLRDRG